MFCLKVKSFSIMKAASMLALPLSLLASDSGHALKLKLKSEVARVDVEQQKTEIQTKVIPKHAPHVLLGSTYTYSSNYIGLKQQGYAVRPVLKLKSKDSIFIPQARYDEIRAVIDFSQDNARIAGNEHYKSTLAEELTFAIRRKPNQNQIPNKDPEKLLKDIFEENMTAKSITMESYRGFVTTLAKLMSENYRSFQNSDIIETISELPVFRQAQKLAKNFQLLNVAYKNGRQREYTEANVKSSELSNIFALWQDEELSNYNRPNKDGYGSDVGEIKFSSEYETKIRDFLNDAKEIIEVLYKGDQHKDNLPCAGLFITYPPNSSSPVEFTVITNREEFLHAIKEQSGDEHEETLTPLSSSPFTQNLYWSESEWDTLMMSHIFEEDLGADKKLVDLAKDDKATSVFKFHGQYAQSIAKLAVAYAATSPFYLTSALLQKMFVEELKLNAGALKDVLPSFMDDTILQDVKNSIEKKKLIISSAHSIGFGAVGHSE